MKNLELIEELETETKECVNEVMNTANFTDILGTNSTYIIMLHKLWKLTELAFKVSKCQAESLDTVLEKLDSIEVKLKNK